MWDFVCDKVPIFVHGFEANELGYTLVVFEVQRTQITGDIERYMSMFCLSLVLCEFFPCDFMSALSWLGHATFLHLDFVGLFL